MAESQSVGVHVQGKDEIKIGLIGSGNRGAGAVVNAMDADKRVKLIAMADLFKNNLQASRDRLQKAKKERVAVDDDHCFVGFDAYEKVLALNLDYVILATPPYFRPAYLLAAVKAKKNVFFEKPAAVDVPGCHKIIEAGEIAKKEGLSLVAGTQRRHQKSYREVYQRIQDGAIGDIRSARIHWNMGVLRSVKPEAGWSELEAMIRDWYNWRWLSGDHIVEQHVHNIDVANWFLSKDGTVVNPIKATGMGGRARRDTGDQWDFFAVDFEYPNGVHVLSTARQINGCANNVTETMVGTLGQSFTAQSGSSCGISGKTPWSLPKGTVDLPYVQEHAALIESLANGKPLNEARNVAISTMTGIMGRTTSYSGSAITWDEIFKSTEKVGPEKVGYDTKMPKPLHIPVQGSA